MKITVYQDADLPTRFVEVECGPGESPVTLLAVVLAAGWVKSNSIQLNPAITQIVKPGSGPFDGWTKAEAKKWVPQLRNLLETTAFGRYVVDWNKKVYAEL